MEQYLLGLSLNHDASASLHQKDGFLISAIQEERLSRKKNHYGIPRLSIEKILESEVPEGAAVEVVIGSHQNLDEREALAMLARLDENPSNKEGAFFDFAPHIYPGFVIDNITPLKMQVEKRIQEIIKASRKNLKLSYVWENHHNSHIGCALANTIGNNENLLISLDGAGDGESGAIALGATASGIRSLSRFSSLDSLGLLYSAVTARYNFRPTVHEGKITGLAAYGSPGELTQLLTDFVEIVDGKPNLKYQKTPLSIIQRILLKFSKSLPSDQKNNKATYFSIGEFIDHITSVCKNYPDLAYAVQKALEVSVCRIVDYWVKHSGVNNLSLAGGVFSNVRLNQSIAELSSVNSVNIFPNMGDGGISAGGVWSHLSTNNRLSHSELYKNMYLGPSILDSEIEIARLDHSLEINKLSPSALPKLIAQDVNFGRMVGLHFDSMEFGPRALGNRTLLLDPRDNNVKIWANKRLNRTEFMPFAPIVAEEYFDVYFRTVNNSLQPFYYMTMTCDVREEYREKLPGITHIDGTARPQIVNTRTNKRAYDIVSEFGKLTGLHVLINTSLNVHEEPINYSLKDSIDALKSNAFDILYFGEYSIEFWAGANRKIR